MLNFTSRNIRIFFRDKTGVIYSLLTIVIIIGLYAVFLNDVVLTDYDFGDNRYKIISNWNMAGLLGIAPITSTMCSLQVMIDDRVNNRVKDLYSTPLTKWMLVTGYILNALVISFLMSAFALCFLELYVFINSGTFHTILILSKVLIIMCLSCVTCSAFVFFIVSFFYTQNVFSIASALIGILSGFITGVYLPIGMMPNVVQIIVKLFPLSHIALLFRKVLLSDLLTVMSLNEIDTVKQYLGVSYKVGAYTISVEGSLIYIFIFTLLSFIFGVVNVSRKKR